MDIIIIIIMRSKIMQISEKMTKVESKKRKIKNITEERCHLSRVIDSCILGMLIFAFLKKRMKDTKGRKQNERNQAW